MVLRLEDIGERLRQRRRQRLRERRELICLAVTLAPFLALSAWVWRQPAASNPGAALAIACAGFVVALSVAALFTRRR